MCTKIICYNFKNCLSPELRNHLIGYVNKHRFCQLAQYRFLADADRSLLSEILMRFLLARAQGRLINSIVITRDRFGRPYPGNTINLAISATHSDHWVCAAISNIPIGIDVERTGCIGRLIANRFYSSSELEWIFSQGKEKEEDAIRDIWISKESYFKAKGIGLAGFFNNILLMPENEKIDENNRKIIIDFYSLTDKDRLAICTLGLQHMPVSLEIIEEFDLAEMLKLVI